ncbi:hypothetical protein BKA69DRAFT_490874 [Paraphysoderma sedebokerense]|nr:hypothetical protein BKA69DRAFT_490874 [Paraphysoderma sedebokerense]
MAFEIDYENNYIIDRDKSPPEILTYAVLEQFLKEFKLKVQKVKLLQLGEVVQKRHDAAAASAIASMTDVIAIMKEFHKITLKEHGWNVWIRQKMAIANDFIIQLNIELAFNWSELYDIYEAELTSSRKLNFGCMMCSFGFRRKKESELTDSEITVNEALKLIKYIRDINHRLVKVEMTKTIPYELYRKLSEKKELPHESANCQRNE